MSKIAFRWAKAVYQLAEEQNLVDAVYEDLKALRETIYSSEEFSRFLKSPVIFNYRKREILAKLFEGKVQKLTLLFLQKLADRGRAPVLADIIDRFEEMYFDKHNILPVKLVTAIEPTEELKKLFVSKLEGFYSKKILLKTETDPNLIGGFRLWVKNKMLDNSVATELQLIKRNFTKSLYVKGL